MALPRPEVAGSPAIRCASSGTGLAEGWGPRSSVVAIFTDAAKGLLTGDAMPSAGVLAAGPPAGSTRQLTGSASETLAVTDSSAVGLTPGDMATGGCSPVSGTFRVPERSPSAQS